MMIMMYVGICNLRYRQIYSCTYVIEKCTRNVCRLDAFKQTGTTSNEAKRQLIISIHRKVLLFTSYVKLFKQHNCVCLREIRPLTAPPYEQYRNYSGLQTLNRSTDGARLIDGCKICSVRIWGNRLGNYYYHYYYYFLQCFCH